MIQKKINSNNSGLFNTNSRFFFGKTAKQRMTYHELLYIWLDSGKTLWKESTYCKYRHIVECHLLPETENVFLDEIDTEYINQFLIKISSMGKGRDTPDLSPTYIRLIAFVIKTSLSFAAQNHYCEPLSGEIRLPSKDRKHKHVLTIKEQRCLESALSPATNEKDLGIFLSLYTGMRIGEVCGLQWNDIDYENGMIHIRRTAERIINHNPENGEKKTKLDLFDTKSLSSNRIIPVPSKIQSVLIDSDKSHTYLIRGRTHDYIDPRTLQYYFEKTLKKCGIRHVNFHALRHTFATRCMESGMDMKSLSELLGHANVNITLGIYVHSSLEHKRKQLEEMSKLFDD